MRLIGELPDLIRTARKLVPIKLKV